MSALTRGDASGRTNSFWQAWAINSLLLATSIGMEVWIFVMVNEIGTEDWCEKHYSKGACTGGDDPPGKSLTGGIWWLLEVIVMAVTFWLDACCVSTH